MAMEILSLNIGSSSLKFALYEMEKEEKILYEGKIEEIQDHDTALRSFFEEYQEKKFPPPIAIGHRVVHGGGKYFKPALITSTLINELTSFIPLAPLHLPLEIHSIKSAMHTFPTALQVACFDTAFHHHMPLVSQTFPLSKDLLGKKVRRFGFHGLSYEYVSSQIKELESKKIIIAHLGNGCSLSAIKKGKAFDTTMGFSPIGGVMMGTRSGDLDPGLILYLLEEKKISSKKLDEVVNHQSGLLGVSEISSDMKELLEKYEQNPNAALAVELFCFQIKKAIGALAASMDGIDLLVFTGGIGEHSAILREKICSSLTFLNMEVQMIPTNEELMIARNTKNLLGERDGS